MTQRDNRRREGIDARNRVWALVCASVLIAGCNASYPTTPTEAVPLALQLHFAQPLGEVSVRSSPSFSAYVIRSDGAWENVTGEAAWSSPDPIVFRSLGSGRFLAETAGTAGVRVQYEGFGAFVDIVVIDPNRQPLPRLSIVAPNPPAVGATAQAGVSLLPAGGGSLNVTAEATWSSSDPSVATVDRGRLTAIGPGTTRITVTHQGLTASYVFSVRPPAR